MDELSDARSMLELTKERLNDQKWLPPDRLVVCLKVSWISLITLAKVSPVYLVHVQLRTIVHSHSV